MLNCTKNDSVWGSVPALGKGAPGLAGFYSYTVYRVLVMSGKGFIPNTAVFGPTKLIETTTIASTTWMKKFMDF